MNSHKNECVSQFSVHRKFYLDFGDKNETLFVRSHASRCEFHSFYHRFLDENNNRDKFRPRENLLEMICWLVSGMKNENLKVVPMWSPSGPHVVPKWSPCGPQVAFL